MLKEPKLAYPTSFGRTEGVQSLMQRPFEVRVRQMNKNTASLLILVRSSARRVVEPAVRGRCVGRLENHPVGMYAPRKTLTRDQVMGWWLLERALPTILQLRGRSRSFIGKQRRSTSQMPLKPGNGRTTR